MARLADAYAEDNVNDVITQDIVITVHTADPGDGGLLNMATLDPIPYVAAGGWTAFVDQAGGRGSSTARSIEYGEATVVETLSWYSIWEADGTTWVLSDTITNPQTTVVANPVRFKAGAISIVGRGAVAA